MQYWYLTVAIMAEVIATSALKSADGFSRVGPGLLVVSGYGLAFYLLALVLKTMPVGITYALWSGIGIALVSLIGFVLYREVPDFPAVLGMSMIVGGVLVIHLFSDSVQH